MMRSMKRQRGVTLIIVLILVLLVTLAGIAAVRSLVVEERMAANSLDRSLAMQGAESVLRQAEAIAQAQSVAVVKNSDFPPYVSTAANVSYDNGTFVAANCTVAAPDPSPCTNQGLCSQPTLGCIPRWESGGTWGTAVVADSPRGTNRNFEYLIEFLGSSYVCDPNDPGDKRNCSQYRITVRSPTGSERAFVQLQSYYLALPK
jgi:type IV pilus assembly protein PilX